MFLSAALRRHPGFRAGMRDMWPQAPGIAAWGLMTGVAMMQSGLSFVESSAMALLVFAGSSQLAALPLIIAGAPAWVILATGFCVNLRFVVFSLHLRPYVMHLPLWQRLTHGYLTADLTYAIFTRRFPQPAQDDEGRLAQEAYLAGNCLVNWGSWVFPSMAGIVLANLIPTRWGLGFAGILCLLGILCSLASTRMRWVAVVVGGAAAITGYALPLKLNIVMAIAVAVLVCLSLEQRPGAGKQVA
ncbi:AzlC family ABC transporter permease [Ramlibacter humi]|uniref:Branched-chain amino acid ABC transporter permease n=1 Tax=Ramlibacter humi TaxID=2530451 RepID=A0A4Z0BVI9_9BURK|nr:AzlC family ABC transporter permease [Ramlibacter humi]TFZ02019.1 branched-chain amino acid ABC transporter permease [Ramlibacter humi]